MCMCMCPSTCASAFALEGGVEGLGHSQQTRYSILLQFCRSHPEHGLCQGVWACERICRAALELGCRGSPSPDILMVACRMK